MTDTDRRRQRLTLACMCFALFTGGSVLCALAPSTSFLIGTRVVQGIGGALMMPSTLSIITNTFPEPAEQARAIGTWAGVSGLALALGPLVGGTMVDHLGWQSIFWINVPIGMIAIAAALPFVPESSNREGRNLDLPGQVTAVIGLAALTYAFIEANRYGWTSTRILSCFVIAAVALSLFVLVELRSRSPLLQLGFFRNRTFSGANLVGIIISFAFFGVILYLGLFMQQVQGYSPTHAGVLQLPATLGVMGAAMLSGRLVARVGARVPITCGLVLLGIGLLMLTPLAPTSPYHSWWYWLLLIGVGNGLVMAPMTAAIMSTVPNARAGMASATSNTMRQIGGVFGIAVLGNLVIRRYTSELTAGLKVMHLPGAAIQKTVAAFSQGGGAATSAPGTLPGGVDVAALKPVIGQSFTSGVHVALWVSGIMLLVGAPIAWTLIRGTSAESQARARAHAEARAQQRLVQEGEPAAVQAQPQLQAIEVADGEAPL